MITGLTLSLRFEIARLRSDLALLRDDEWRLHYNENDYGGRWRGVALRSMGGSSSDLNDLPGIPASAFSATDILERCVYFRELLAVFPCPLKAVRLLSLAPASFVREHSDPALRYEDGEMRIHVPIQSSADVDAGVEFYLAGERLHLEEGACYYLNVSLPHRISNRSPYERVHMVIDLEWDEWAHEMVKRGLPIERLPHRTRGFENFRRRILRDSSLAKKVSAASDASEFQKFAVRVGRDLGFDFTADEIGSSWCSGNDDNFDARGWAPVAARIRDGQPMADWVFFGQRRPTEPFFEESVRLALRNPLAKSLRFEAPLRAPEGIREPTGFIFHMSRCGSTLVSRALASLPRVLAISEAPVIDAMLQSGCSDWVRAAILALGRLGEGDEDHYIVKFDAWNTHRLSLIRAAFPETPWMFLYRDPLEVLVSQIRSPGMHCLAGAMDPAILGMTFEDIVSLNREEWSVRVLAKFLVSALDHRRDPLRLFVDYRELPHAIWGCIAEHFGVALSDEDVRRMEEMAQFHAKMPQLPFAPDSKAKQEEASESVRMLARQLLEPLYRQLSTVR